MLPRAARLSLAAGSFVALLNFALTGLLNQRGSLIARALPFPILNLVVVIVLAGIAVAVNRAIVHALRTRREGPPRVVLAGDEADLDLARRHLAAVDARPARRRRRGRRAPCRRRGGPRARGPPTCSS